MTVPMSMLLFFAGAFLIDSGVKAASSLRITLGVALIAKGMSL